MGAEVSRRSMTDLGAVGAGHDAAEQADGCPFASGASVELTAALDSVFRKSEALGANARPPVRVIVVTDDLVALANDPDDGVAVLAHEVGISKAFTACVRSSGRARVCRDHAGRWRVGALTAAAPAYS